MKSGSVVFMMDIGEAGSSVVCGPCQGQSLSAVAVLGFLGWTVCTPHAGCSLYPAAFKVALFNILQKPLIC